MSFLLYKIITLYKHTCVHWLRALSFVSCYSQAYIVWAFSYMIEDKAGLELGCLIKQMSILILFWIEPQYLTNSWIHSVPFAVIIYWTIFVITCLVPFGLVMLKTWIIMQNNNYTWTCFSSLVFELSTYDILYWLDICSSEYRWQY
jgi:hypothetical protein